MKYKKIVGFGDSFVQGLIKEPIMLSQKEMEEINFITQIGKKLNIKYENYGVRAYSQNSIAFEVIKYLELNKPSTDTLFLIFWSGFERINFYSNISKRYDSRDVEVKNGGHSGNATDFMDLIYLNNINIRGIHSLLTSINQPFLMSNSFMRLQDVEYINFKGIESNWIEETLFEMCVGDGKTPADFEMNKKLLKGLNHTSPEYFETNHPNLSGCNHPSIEGHKVIADKLIDYIQNNNFDISK